MFATLMNDKPRLMLIDVIGHLRKECVERTAIYLARNAKPSDSNYVSQSQRRAKAPPKRISNATKRDTHPNFVRSHHQQNPLNLNNHQNKGSRDRESTFLLEEKNLTVNSCDS